MNAFFHEILVDVRSCAFQRLYYSSERKKQFQFVVNKHQRVIHRTTAKVTAKTCFYEKTIIDSNN